MQYNLAHSQGAPVVQFGEGDDDCYIHILPFIPSLTLAVSVFSFLLRE
jgi:hypothetical protein